MSDLVHVPQPAALAVPDSRLAALDDAAEQYLIDSRRSNTAKGHRSDWRAWLRYCAELGIPETSHTKGALVGFVLWLRDREMAPTTVDRRLAGVVVTLIDMGIEPSHEARKSARRALNVYREDLTRDAITLGRGQAPAATVGHLHRISAACPDTLAGRRDLALVLLGFRFASRSAELANLLVADVEDHQDKGLVVVVRYGKTGARRVVIPPGRDEDICPVRAWRAWREVADGDGPAFCRVGAEGRIRRDPAGRPLPLAPKAVSAIVTRAAGRAGVPIRLTGHSLRAGLATEARRARHDRKTISGITGHSPTSATLEGYFRPVDEWREAPNDIL